MSYDEPLQSSYCLFLKITLNYDPMLFAETLSSSEDRDKSHSRIL